MVNKSYDIHSSGQCKCLCKGKEPSDVLVNELRNSFVERERVYKEATKEEMKDYDLVRFFLPKNPLNPSQRFNVIFAKNEKTFFFFACLLIYEVSV